MKTTKRIIIGILLLITAAATTGCDQAMLGAYLTEVGSLYSAQNGQATYQPPATYSPTVKTPEQCGSPRNFTITVAGNMQSCRTDTSCNVYCY